jgi:hypothetical protein
MVASRLKRTPSYRLTASEQQLLVGSRCTGRSAAGQQQTLILTIAGLRYWSESEAIRTAVTKAAILRANQKVRSTGIDVASGVDLLGSGRCRRPEMGV